MSQYKDFQGKSLDDAISEACAYYGVEREKLEIEIISDAKTGIFGLVGAKKASIRAARVQLPERISVMVPDNESLAASPKSAHAHSAAADGVEAPPHPVHGGGSEQRRRADADNAPKTATDKGRSGRDGRPKTAHNRDAASPSSAQAAGSPSDNAAKNDQPAPSRDKRNTDTGPSIAPDGKSRHTSAPGDPDKGGRGNREQNAGRRSPGKPSAPGGSGEAARTDASGLPAAHGRDAGRRPGKGREAAKQPNLEADAKRSGGGVPARGGNKRDNGSEPRRDDRWNGRPFSGRAADQERSGEAGQMPLEEFSSADFLEPARDEFPEFALDGCNQQELFSVVSDVIRCMVEPIVGEAPCVVTIHGNRVRASVDCGDASGLLVGREGQTLAAVQYLAARIIAKRIGGFLRLQIDAGNYRERQDDKLKEVALALAERAKATRRSQSTRPLSAYQRRIVHLALEGDEAVQTHSKGEGAQRRVIIQPKRAAGRSGEADAHSPEFLEADAIHNTEHPAGLPEVTADAAEERAVDLVPSESDARV